MSTVGKSDRTPFKHWVLNCQLGKVCGALSSKSPKNVAKPPLVVIDLCAGDGGVCDDYISSPWLIFNHCNNLASRGVPVQAYFIEKSVNTFRELERNLDEYGERHDLFHVEILLQDARDFRLPSGRDRRQAIFVNGDPNHIHEMPFSDSLASSLTMMTTMTMTLGCNVGGIKRMAQFEREKWFEYVDKFIRIMPHWHDAHLVELLGDAAQWGYFSRVPKKWSCDLIRKTRNAGEKQFNRLLNVVSLSDDPDGFAKTLKRLFLTKKELSSAD